MALIRALLARNPASPDLNNNLGVLLLFLRRDAEAEVPLLTAAGGEKAPVSAQLNLAGLYARRGDRERSALYCRRALENPALPPAEKDAIRRSLR